METGDVCTQAYQSLYPDQGTGKYEELGLHTDFSFTFTDIPGFRDFTISYEPVVSERNLQLHLTLHV